MSIIIKMNRILILTLTMICTAVSADILDASEAYQNQDYESAFEQYLELAHLGNTQARYNVAVMYFQGQGVAKNLNKAYGWAKLIDFETNSDLINLVNEIEKQLTPAELDQAKQMAKHIQAEYGDDEIFSKLAPISYQPNNNNSSEEYTLKITQRHAPRYPKAELQKLRQGWVRAGFDVYPDGSVRNLYVIESVPEGVFDEVTLEALEKFKFDINFKEGVKPYPIQVTQMVQFELAVKNKKKLAQVYKEHVEKLEDLAHKGHPDAQYYYALAASAQSPINQYIKLDHVEVNDWLLKAAQNGNLDAQYLLGQNILSGKGCQVEKQKAIDWIVFAADKGHAKSARTAFHLLTKSDQLNNTNKPPEYWLKKAADGGDPESQLEYAHFLAFSQKNSEAISSAKRLLKQYLKERDKSVKYHQVMAQLYTLENDEKKAKKEMKKANKLAKKLGWDI
jgi:TonB family protein